MLAPLQRSLAQERLEFGQIDRLGEVPVESGLFGPVPILLLAIAGQGHEQGLFECRLSAEQAGQLR